MANGPAFGAGGKFKLSPAPEAGLMPRWRLNALLLGLRVFAVNNVFSLCSLWFDQRFPDPFRMGIYSVNSVVFVVNRF